MGQSNEASRPIGQQRTPGSTRASLIDGEVKSPILAGEGLAVDEQDAENARELLGKLVTDLNIGNGDNLWDLGGPFQAITPTPANTADGILLARLPGFKEIVVPPISSSMPDRWFDEYPPSISAGHIKWFIIADTALSSFSDFAAWYEKNAPLATTKSQVVHMKLIMAPGLYSHSSITIPRYIHRTWSTGAHPITTRVRFLIPENDVYAADAAGKLLARVMAVRDWGNNHFLARAQILPMDQPITLEK